MMFRNLYEQLRGYRDGIPNTFTRSVGELVRKARLDSKMSQAELAEKAYFSQAAISQLEQGKRDITAAEILYLCDALNKPILYFYQYVLASWVENTELTLHEKELVIQARRLSDSDLKKLIAQARALADYTGDE